MEVRNLLYTKLEAVVECLLNSFSDYYVQMPTKIDYWKKRFHGARVDMELSFGMFKDEKLIGFIINGVDIHQNQLTAFNTGTGVISAYRGEGIVYSLYNFAMPVFKSRGITKCVLEVIRENKMAIHVYERIGFKIIRNLYCFKGTISRNTLSSRTVKTEFLNIPYNFYQDEDFYSWDNSYKGILASGDLIDTYVVKDNLDRELGYFTINSQTGYMARVGIPKLASYTHVLNAIATVSEQIKINNVDERRKGLISSLKENGLLNTINQFEMELYL